MSALWLVQALLVSVLLGLGARAAERVVGWFGGSRRAVWALAMIGSLVLPALALFFPGALPDLGILPETRRASSIAPGGLQWLGGGGAARTSRLPGDPSGSFDLTRLFGMGWLSLSLATLAALVWSYRRLSSARAAAVAMRVDGYPVRVAERLGPAVVGFRHPVILIPRWVLEARAEERRLILTHEREHLASGDSWLLLWAALAVAAMPWNLPLWWQHRRLRAAVEADCDARVLARGTDRRAYGRILIRTAGDRPLLPLLSPAWGETTSQLERRIMNMTEKRPAHPLLRSIPLLALALAVVATACDVVGTPSARDEDLATGPASAAKAAPSVTAMRDIDAVHSIIPVSRGQTSGTIGLRSLHWPDHQGPRYDEELGLQAPKTHPVIAVEAGGAAWKGGLRDGDVILTVNGADARQPYLFADLRPGTRYTVHIRRGNAERDVQVVVEAKEAA